MVARGDIVFERTQESNHLFFGEGFETNIYELNFDYEKGIGVVFSSDPAVRSSRFSLGSASFKDDVIESGIGGQIASALIAGAVVLILGEAIDVKEKEECHWGDRESNGNCPEENWSIRQQQKKEEIERWHDDYARRRGQREIDKEKEEKRKAIEKARQDYQQVIYHEKRHREVYGE